MMPAETFHNPTSSAVEDNASLFGVNTIIMGIIHARGYDTPRAIHAYLHGNLSDLHSPFLFNDMCIAVERIRKAIEHREQIGIFADSDIDGITSLAVLHSLFSRMKIEPYLRYLKDDENYGITNNIIDEFHDNGVTLIITVDSGTRDVSEISHARSLGIDVIVTDHHEQDAVLPDAIVINPKTEGSAYPCKNLAGVGVAFKLAHALLMSYLPSYKKRFLIVVKTKEQLSVAYIRDCIIEKIEPFSGIDQLIELLASAGSNDYILVDDNDILSECLTAYPGRKISLFTEFIAGIMRHAVKDIDALCQAWSIQRNLYPTQLDLYTKIFMETQLYGSEKVINFIDSVIGLVAIGSIADVINLTGENRVLVKAGMESLKKTGHQALSLLMNGERIDSRFIGWTIAPLLNTPGRLGKTDLVVRLFVENDPRKLAGIISEIRALNEDRRHFIKQVCGTFLENIGNGTLASTGKLIHIKTDAIPEGYAGLIANRIADVTGKPVIVTVLPGKNGIVKGSGRARGGSHFFSLFNKYTDRFERIGGHENAFGFTVHADKIDDIINSIEKTIASDEKPAEGLDVDCELDIAVINARFIEELQILEPFGYGNKEPQFLARNISFGSFMKFGNNHGKFSISDYNPLTAIGWGMAPEMKSLFDTECPLDVIFRLENNIYNGKVSPRMILLQIMKSG